MANARRIPSVRAVELESESSDESDDTVVVLVVAMAVVELSLIVDIADEIEVVGDSDELL